jgi:hypothetical protein
MTKELVVRKESKRYPGLFTVKYHNRVFYDNLWTDELRESRGRVELADGTVVVNPFTKIFNRNENGTDINSQENCVVSLKVNGFMAAATYVPFVNKVVVSTTGSLDSDFVGMAEEYITDSVKNRIEQNYQGKTLLFEVCHPNDPHIIPQVPGIYLIGMREVNNKAPYFSTPSYERTLDYVGEVLGVERTVWCETTFLDLLIELKTAKLEGAVVYGQKSGTVLKIKSPYYLANKAVARIRDIEKLNRKFIDEEFYPLIEYAKGIDRFSELPEQQKLQLLRDYYV